MHRLGLKSCPYCGSEQIYRTHATRVSHRILRIFLFRLARCHYCMRRHFRPVFFPLLEVKLRGEALPAAAMCSESGQTRRAA